MTRPYDDKIEKEKCICSGDAFYQNGKKTRPLHYNKMEKRKKFDVVYVKT